METKEKRFTLKTEQGCKQLLALLLVVIFLSSCFATLLSSDCGSIKISHVVIDSRGATLEGDLYIPAGTSDTDSLPAILVTHGRGAIRTFYKGIAEELARRGFVVMDFSAYGTGLSEVPKSDDGGQGQAGYVYDKAPQGVLDAVNYLRTLHYVDKTRVGVMGHSGGSRRVGYSATIDCGYFTFNDTMINVLHDKFGVKISESELYTDADKLAAKYLPADQITYYNSIKDQEYSKYNNRIKSICLVGSDASVVQAPKTVTVAGYNVTRSCQVNFGIINGALDFNYRTYNTSENAKKSWYTNNSIALKSWYSLDDKTQSSSVIGTFDQASVAKDSNFANSIQHGVMRICMLSPLETHPQNFLSAYTTTNIIKYFEQTLNYNRGNLTDASTVPLDPENSHFILREICNGIAMLAMLFLAFPIVGIFLKRKRLACDVDSLEIGTTKVSKKQYWIFSAIIIVATFFAIYQANKVVCSPFVSRYLPDVLSLVSTDRTTLAFIFYTGLISLISLFCIVLINKKLKGSTGLSSLHVNINFKDILKYFGLSFGILAFSYMVLLIIEYLFNQNFQFWVAAYTDMKVEYWGIAAVYMIIMLPIFLVNSAALNYTVRTDIPQWKDSLITVAVNAGGLWLCCLVDLIMMVTTGNSFSSFVGAYQMVLIIPITIYISRKCYNMTKSIWLGSFINAMFVAWSLVSTNGVNDMYHAIGFFSRFFNI